MEGNLIKRIQLRLSGLLTVRTFRNNTGKGWQGAMEWQGQNKLILHNPRPLDAGLVKGSSDLIGWKTVEITPDMVGRQVAVFVAIEVKEGRTGTSPEQANFLDRVRQAGGLCGIARTPDDAVTIINQL